MWRKKLDTVFWFIYSSRAFFFDKSNKLSSAKVTWQNRPNGLAAMLLCQPPINHGHFGNDDTQLRTQVVQQLKVWHLDIMLE